MHFSNHRTDSFKSPAWKSESALFFPCFTPASVSAISKSGWSGVLTLTQSPSVEEDSDDPFGDFGFRLSGEDGFAAVFGVDGFAAGGSSSESSSSTICIFLKPLGAAAAGDAFGVALAA